MPHGNHLRVALVGHHEKDYPRNCSIKGALEAAGAVVTECHSTAPFPLRHLILAYKYFRIHRTIDVIFVTEGGHRLVPLLRLWAMMTGKPLVFDPFLSRYNTRVEDRGLHKPGSLQAWICKWQDWSSTHAAHALVFDTEEHRDYFYTNYRLDKPSAIIPVGVDESVFRHDLQPPPPTSGTARFFEVLFYGTYIPLQGIEHILGAAAILQEEAPDVRLRLIGRGQTYPAMRKMADTLSLRNVEFKETVSTRVLAEYIAASNVCLGIFGDTLKAHNVVPNKVVQGAAMGAALITADTPAIRRYFKENEEIFLVPPGNPQALADKILLLRVQADLRRAAGAGAWRVFEHSFSNTSISATLSSFLRSVLARHQDV